VNVVSLFDHSAVLLEPWSESGFDCWAVDIAHPRGHTVRDDGVNLIGHDLAVPWLPPFPKSSIAFVAAFPPCDHLAVSGARWFAGKGLRALARSVELFATAAEFCEWSDAPYFIENPVSTISTYWRKPDHIIHPWQYAGLHSADNYTKTTCLWTGGGFVLPEPEPLDAPGLFNGKPPDDRIHKMPPSAQRAALRSETPRGLALALHAANQ